jgi:hypothetical protein
MRTLQRPRAEGPTYRNPNEHQNLSSPQSRGKLAKSLPFKTDGIVEFDAREFCAIRYN